MGKTVVNYSISPVKVLKFSLKTTQQQQQNNTMFWIKYLFKCLQPTGNPPTQKQFVFLKVELPPIGRESPLQTFTTSGWSSRGHSYLHYHCPDMNSEQQQGCYLNPIPTYYLPPLARTLLHLWNIGPTENLRHHPFQSNHFTKGAMTYLTGHTIGY